VKTERNEITGKITEISAKFYNFSQKNSLKIIILPNLLKISKIFAFSDQKLSSNYIHKISLQKTSQNSPNIHKPSNPLLSMPKRVSFPDF
jgi:hypothetical protein